MSCRRFGSVAAGWTVASEYLSKDSVVWSAGIGEDITFDLAIAEEWGLAIDAFDPTPRALAWVAKQNVPNYYRVHKFGFAGEDGEAVFTPPANPNFVSHRLVNLSERLPSDRSIPGFIAEVRTLDTLASLLLQKHVDLLKMDIEGAEYAVIENMRPGGLLPFQLLIEFHHRFEEFGICRTINAVAKLRQLGYRLFHVSPSGEEYAFLHIAE